MRRPLLAVLLMTMPLQACDDASGPLPEPAPDITDAVYALTAVRGRPLPQSFMSRARHPSLLADTIRFNIAYAAKVPGPLALSRATLADPGGRVTEDVFIFRYLQDGSDLSFPPICVPSAGCVTRFRRGTLDAKGMTLETFAPFQGPLRYTRLP